jgi:secreted trypsin-like serine protease
MRIFTLFLSALLSFPVEARVHSAIVGGQEAAANSAIAASTVLIKGKIQRASFTCTGTIIDEDTILTAGHCLGGGGYAALTVYFGIHGEIGEWKVVNQIRRADIPEDDREFDWDDVAILKLEKKIPNGFRPVKLLEDISPVRAGVSLVLAGYGQTVVDPPKDGNGGSGVLRFVEQTILQAPFGEREILVNIHERGACRGDSGGPAFLMIGDSLYLAGLASRLTENDRIPNNGRDKQYGCRVDMVYTSLPAQLGWIKANK